MEEADDSRGGARDRVGTLAVVGFDIGSRILVGGELVAAL